MMKDLLRDVEVIVSEIKQIDGGCWSVAFKVQVNGAEETEELGQDRLGL